jgi:hypothetical protein
MRGILVYNALRQVITRRSNEAGITGVELHDSLKCLNQGMDLLTLSRILGPKDTALLARYAKQRTDDLQVKYKAIWENR